MEVLRSREIVIEYERIQLIKKRATTQVAHCTECGGESDFVPLKTAAELLNTETGVLTTFVGANRSHIQIDSVGTVFVCIASLLSQMRERLEDTGDGSTKPSKLEA